jgi:hypothetical protein
VVEDDVLDGMEGLLYLEADAPDHADGVSFEGEAAVGCGAGVTDKSANCLSRLSLDSWQNFMYLSTMRLK